MKADAAIIVVTFMAMQEIDERHNFLETNSVRRISQLLLEDEARPFD